MVCCGLFGTFCKRQKAQKTPELGPKPCTPSSYTSSTALNKQTVVPASTPTHPKAGAKPEPNPNREFENRLRLKWARDMIVMGSRRLVEARNIVHPTVRRDAIREHKRSIQLWEHRKLDIERELAENADGVARPEIEPLVVLTDEQCDEPEPDWSHLLNSNQLALVDLTVPVREQVFVLRGVDGRVVLEEPKQSGTVQIGPTVFKYSRHKRRSHENMLHITPSGSRDGIVIDQNKQQFIVSWR